MVRVSHASLLCRHLRNYLETTREVRRQENHESYFTLVISYRYAIPKVNEWAVAFSGPRGAAASKN